MRTPLLKAPSANYGQGITGNVTSPTNSSGKIITSQTIAQLLSMQSAQMPMIEKTKLRVIVVKKDDTTVLLSEQSSITPNEMIGITKFMMLISSSMTAVAGGGSYGYNFTINWTELIKNLAIEKHFIPGDLFSTYTDDDEVLNVFLFDPDN